MIIDIALKLLNNL